MISLWWKVGARYAKYWVPALFVVAILIYVYNAGRSAVLEEQAAKLVEDFIDTTRNINNAVRTAPSTIDDARDWLREFSGRKY